MYLNFNNEKMTSKLDFVLINDIDRNRFLIFCCKKGLFISCCMGVNFYIKFFYFQQAAATCYIKLIEKESDNNVKLIVLDRLIALKENPSHERVLQDLVMDILCVLSSPDLEVRKKTLNLGAF